MFAARFAQARCNRLGETGKVIIMMRIETRRFDKPPEPFGPIEMRRIGPQKEPCDRQPFGFGHDKLIALLLDVIQDDRNGSIGEFLGHVW